ncbi:MAG: D-alanyl-D-alanine carboxypeptidase, partial [Candidatus Omnitrophica bacterium]|nr:D-alanyl-D-alanine carboxypeptidase [Candidatus Omnitrophota bacterium]
AESIAGSEENFARLRNRKANALGMRYTHFVNASGLPDKKRRQYSTAYDLALLMRYALRNKIFDRIISTKSAVISGSDGKRIYLTNHNKLLKTQPKFIVGKTGYTLEAKHCFLGADYGVRKNIVFSILYSRNPWQDIKRLAVYGLRLEKKK